MIELRHNPEASGELSLMIFAQGNQVEVLYNFILDLMELNVSRTPLDDDMAYMYLPKPMDTTVFMFRGKSWLYPVAKLYSEMSNKIQMAGWSNWEMEFIEKGQLKLGSIDMDLLGIEDFPAVGNLAFMTAFIQAKMDVDVDEATIDTDEMVDALSGKIEVDDAHS